MHGVTLRRIALLTGVALAAITAAFFVSPALAGTSSGLSWSSNCADSSVFGSLDRLAVGSTARGDEAREPSLNQTIESPSTQRGRGRGFRATVPTYVHVVSLPDGTGNVSDRAIRDQIGS